MRIALVANPKSGSAPAPERLAELLAAGGADVRTFSIEDVCDGDGALNGDTVASLWAGKRPHRIVVAGGDGSIGPSALLAARLIVPLAVVAVGTANDFARAKGLPLDLEEACALARAPRPRCEPAELGLAGERPFVNVAAAGLSVAAADAAREHKPRLGALAYAVGAAKAAARAEPLRCRVRCDGSERFEGRAWQVVVGVTGAFGGGSAIGETELDGRLDVAVVPAGSRLGLMRRAYGMRRGRLVEQDDVAHERCATVELDGVREFNVDGEVCRCEPGHFALHDPGFEVVVG